MKPSELTPVTVRQIIHLAAAIERDEPWIKQPLIVYARDGDCRSIIKFTTMWQSRASSWVAASIRASRLTRSKPRRRGRGAS